MQEKQIKKIIAVRTLVLRDGQVLLVGHRSPETDRVWWMAPGGMVDPRETVMEAAARGARAEGGLTVGILPGSDRFEANPHIQVGVATDLGHARNVVLVRSSDGLIAVGGGYGTLSEMAIALKTEKPVVSLGSWELGPPVIVAKDPHDAVEKIIQALERG